LGSQLSTNHDRSGGDHAACADRHTGQNDCAGSEPATVPDDDRRALGRPATSCGWPEGVCRGEEHDLRADTDVGAQPDLRAGAVDEDTVIDPGAVADLDLRADKSASPADAHIPDREPEASVEPPSHCPTCEAARGNQVPGTSD